MHDKEEYVIHAGKLKQTLNHGLVLTNVIKVIKFTDKRLLKSYIAMNTELNKNVKNDLGKDFFKLMNNEVFEKLSKM